jgi:predicted transcriptional regulator
VPRPLRQDEQTLAALLQRTGLSRPASRCLVCLARGGEWTSGALAETAGLSQPGVSQGMRELITQGLVVRDFQHSGEKGRPAHLYSIAGAAPDTLGRIERAKREELETELGALDELRAMIKKLE